MRSRTATAGAIRFHPGEFALSIAVGLVVGGIGAAVLWLLIRQLQHPTPDPGAAATLPGASRTRRHRRPARRRLDPHLWVPETRLTPADLPLSTDESPA